MKLSFPVGVLLAVFVLTNAHAELHAFTWVLPTQLEDNSPIPAAGDGAILEMVINCADTEANALAKNYTMLSVTLMPTQTRLERDFANGNYYCKMGVRNSAGWSPPSAILSFVVPFPTPVVVPPPVTTTKAITVFRIE